MWISPLQFTVRTVQLLWWRADYSSHSRIQTNRAKGGVDTESFWIHEVLKSTADKEVIIPKLLCLVPSCPTGAAYTVSNIINPIIISSKILLSP